VPGARIEHKEDVIEHFGEHSEYPYHVLRTQRLKWARRAIPQNDPRRTFLQKILNTVENGRNYHAQEEKLKVLQAELKKEILLTLVNN
jgi:hypothetical protein